MTNYKDIKRIPIVAADVPNLAASKITSGTLDNARITLDAAEIPNLDTAKTTTGTFVNSRISAGSVTQHVTAFDDNKIVTDLGQLALHQAINENKASYSTQNMRIEQFEDDTGLATQTDGDRNTTSEYWATVSQTSTAIPVKLLVTGGTTSSSTVTDTSATPMTISTSGSPTWTTAAYKYGTNSMLLNGTSQYITIADHINFNYDNDNNGYTMEMWFKIVSTTGSDAYGNITLWGQSGTSGNGNPRNIMWITDNDTIYNYASAHTPAGVSGDISGATMEDGNWHHLAKVYEYNSGNGKANIALDGVWFDSPASTYSPGDHANAFFIGRTQSGIATTTRLNAYIDSFRLTHESLYTIGTPFTAPTTMFGTTKTTTTASATGTLISTASTANATVSNAHLIVLYTDDGSGATSLNTDLIGKISSDGTNYTTVTLVAKQNFSTGIKMAVANDVTLSNTGTSMKYRLDFANQALSTKETQVKGVALLY